MELCNTYINGKPKDLHFLFKTSHSGISLAFEDNEKNVTKFENIYLPEDYIKHRIECNDECSNF